MSLPSCQDLTWGRLVDATPLLLLAALALVGAAFLGSWLFCTVSVRRGQPLPEEPALFPEEPTPLYAAPAQPPPPRPAAPAAPAPQQEALTDTIRVLEEVNDLLTRLECDLPKLETNKQLAGEGTHRKMTQVSTVMQLKLTRLAEDLETISKKPNSTFCPRPDTSSHDGDQPHST